MSFADTPGKRVVNSGAAESRTGDFASARVSSACSSAASLFVSPSVELLLSPASNACRTSLWLLDSGQGCWISVDAIAEPHVAASRSNAGMLDAPHVALCCDALNVFTGPPFVGLSLVL